MPTEVMSLTRALAELKSLDDRILRAISEAVLVGVVKGSSETPLDRKHKSKEALETAIKASGQSVEALMARRTAIKRALTNANAVTMVNINGQSMTIADAIDLKQQLGTKDHLLRTMVNALHQAASQVDAQNRELEAQVERMVLGMFANDKGKVDPEVGKSVRQAQLAQHEARLVDPLNLSDKIFKMKEELDGIRLNIDFTLSEVNAKTEVTVSY